MSQHIVVFKGKRPAISVPFTNLQTHLRAAYYEHGLVSPDWAVYQSRSAAEDDLALRLAVRMEKRLLDLAAGG